jgi:hypothetical protein
MASCNAIAAVSRAILDVLETDSAQTDFGKLQFEIYDVGKFDLPMDQGFSLYLWRVTPNSTRRTLPPRREQDGRAFRPSLPVDLHFLLTPWAKDAEQQHRMLGWAMRQLEDVIVLPAGILNHKSQPDTFRPSETVEIFCDALPLGDFLNLWDKLKATLQVSVNYQVRNVFIDSQQPWPEYPLVQKRELQGGAVAS